MRGWNIRERMRNVVSMPVGASEAGASGLESDYEMMDLDREVDFGEDEALSVCHLSPFIDEMEEMICTATRLPLSSKALVDQEQCLATLDVLRASWPLEVLEAQRVLAQEGEVLQRAEEEGEEIKRQAERQAELILDQSQLVKVAEVRAQEVIEAAQHEAVRIRARAEQDARDVYEGLEHELDLLTRDIKDLVSARLRRLKS